MALRDAVPRQTAGVVDRGGRWSSSPGPSLCSAPRLHRSSGLHSVCYLLSGATTATPLGLFEAVPPPPPPTTWFKRNMAAVVVPIAAVVAGALLCLVLLLLCAQPPCPTIEPEVMPYDETPGPLTVVSPMSPVEPRAPDAPQAWASAKALKRAPSGCAEAAPDDRPQDAVIALVVPLDALQKPAAEAAAQGAVPALQHPPTEAPVLDAAARRRRQWRPPPPRIPEGPNAARPSPPVRCGPGAEGADLLMGWLDFNHWMRHQGPPGAALPVPFAQAPHALPVSFPFPGASSLPPPPALHRSAASDLYDPYPPGSARTAPAPPFLRAPAMLRPHADNTWAQQMRPPRPLPPHEPPHRPLGSEPGAPREPRPLIP